MAFNWMGYFRKIIMGLRMNKSIKNLVMIVGLSTAGVGAWNIIEYLNTHNQIIQIEKSSGKEAAYEFANTLGKYVQGPIDNIMHYGLKKSYRDYIKDNN